MIMTSISKNNSKWLLRAFDEGLISDLDAFEEFLQSNNLIITTATVECIDKEGHIRKIKIDSSKIFTCCSCSSSSCNKSGKQCPYCDTLMCTNCSSGNIIHLCNNLENTSVSHSKDDNSNHPSSDNDNEDTNEFSETFKD